MRIASEAQQAVLNGPYAQSKLWYKEYDRVHNEYKVAHIRLDAMRVHLERCVKRVVGSLVVFKMFTQPDEFTIGQVFLVVGVEVNFDKDVPESFITLEELKDNLGFYSRPRRVSPTYPLREVKVESDPTIFENFLIANKMNRQGWNAFRKNL